MQSTSANATRGSRCRGLVEWVWHACMCACAVLGVPGGRPRASALPLPPAWAQELADERERVARAKEVEVARLRAMQEKILDNRSAQARLRGCLAACLLGRPGLAWVWGRTAACCSVACCRVDGTRLGPGLEPPHAALRRTCCARCCRTRRVPSGTRMSWRWRSGAGRLRSARSGRRCSVTWRRRAWRRWRARRRSAPRRPRWSMPSLSASWR